MKTLKALGGLTVVCAVLLWSVASFSVAQEAASGQPVTTAAPAGERPAGPGFGPGGMMFDPAQIFDRLDTNKDGQVSKQEFESFVPPRMGDRAGDRAGDRGRDRAATGQRTERGPAEGDFAARMRDGVLSRLKEQMGCTDEEWAVLKPRVEKVMEAQQAQRMGAMMRFGAGMRGDRQAPDTPSQPEADALRKAVEDKNAKAEDVQKKLEAFRAAKKKQDAELNTARTQLRELLTARQEAALVLAGILD
jgi:hypothetical protein